MTSHSVSFMALFFRIGCCYGMSSRELWYIRRSILRAQLLPGKQNDEHFVPDKPYGP